MFRLPALFVTNLYIAWLTLLPPWSSLSGLLRCCLPGSKFFTFSSNKISLFFQAVTNFLVDSFGQLIKGPRADSSPLPELYEELEPWYQQRHTRPHLLPRRSEYIWVNLSWFSDLLYWLKSLNFYLVGYSRYCPLSAERYGGVGGVERHWNILTPWTRYWVGLGSKIVRNTGPTERYEGDCLKGTKEIPPSGRHWWGGSVQSYQGIPAAQSKDTEVLCCRMYGAYACKYLVNWRN